MDETMQVLACARETLQSEGSTYKVRNTALDLKPEPSSRLKGIFRYSCIPDETMRVAAYVREAPPGKRKHPQGAQCSTGSLTRIAFQSRRDVRIFL